MAGTGVNERRYRYRLRTSASVISAKFSHGMSDPANTLPPRKRVTNVASSHAASGLLVGSGVRFGAPISNVGSVSSDPASPPLNGAPVSTKPAIASCFVWQKRHAAGPLAR